MLRRDTAARFDKTGAWIFSRFRFTSGRLEADQSLSRASYGALLAQQENEPVLVLLDEERRRAWWLFRGEFYWDDEGFQETEVKALVLQRNSQKDRRVKHAVALMEQTEAMETASRTPIPDEVKVFVWKRDNGCCVRCGSNERLEFDHVIPLAMGGSNTARNLQLLCEPCNRAKGASLV
ncbi:MAG TPA: HNH endonuclease signature motif containing protein [Dehalococcoidia bacterium]|nr:HNH endonuclease signature motif containing protein [Dehalococcoidia bacterium]